MAAAAAAKTAAPAAPDGGPDGGGGAAAGAGPRHRQLVLFADIDGTLVHYPGPAALAEVCGFFYCWCGDAALQETHFAQLCGSGVALCAHGCSVFCSRTQTPIASSHY